VDRIRTLAKLSLTTLVLLGEVTACSGPTGHSGSQQAALSATRAVPCEAVVNALGQALRAAGSDAPDADERLTAASDRVLAAWSTAGASRQPALLRLYDAVVGVRGVLGGGSVDSLDRALPAAAAEVAAFSATCAAASPRHDPLPPGAGKIKHVVVVMQENRSFDHYFGTYPGADGIPRKHGAFTVCVPNPVTGGCDKPHHDSTVAHHGGPHTYDASVADIDHGKMDGFVAQWEATRKYCLEGDHASRPTCRSESARPDVMGYHDRRDIPNYWAYADNFVLQDHMFEPNLGWSQPAHLSMVSGWSAVCGSPYRPVTCRPSVTFNDIDKQWPHQPSYAWTDITYLLQQHGVRWRYYVAPGSTNDCEGTTDQMIHCTPGVHGFDPIGTPEPWNPLPDFTDVRTDHQVKNVQFHRRFFTAADAGTLPSVSWVEPGWYDSEHPPTSIARGQAWVTRVVNAVMKGPDWKSTVIFLAWDDWGGFYDHVQPPYVDGVGYGLRVPALMISAYAKKGYIDHQTYSFDSYLKFIEDRFLGGQRLDPYTDGRWDPRPDVRENAHVLGDLMREFDLSRPPRRPLILPLHPRP
jgi:phospholipase C